MSISSPDVPETSAEAKRPAPESSSLMLWLILTGVLMTLGVIGVVVVQWMPAQTGDFLIPPKPKGPPGKTVLTPGDPIYKFGVMPSQQEGKHTWTLKNDGEGDLILSKGKATCSCTIANFEQGKTNFTLAPGKSTEITLTWKTNDSDGKFEKSAAIIVVNDPNRDLIEFEIVGIVKPAITVHPKERTLDFAVFPSNETRHLAFAIASADKPDLKIIDMTSTRPTGIALKAKPLSDGDRTALDLAALKGGYQIDVEVKPSNTLGRFSDEITIITDHPALKEVKVAIGGKRVGPVTLTPDSIILHNVYSEDGGSRSLMMSVRNAPETTFDVVAAPSNLKVKVIPADVKTGSAGKVRFYKLEVTVPADSPAEKIESMIVLKSNHPDFRELKIPVDIEILEGSATGSTRSGVR